MNCLNFKKAPSEWEFLLSVVAHTCNPSTWEIETGPSVGENVLSPVENLMLQGRSMGEHPLRGEEVYQEFISYYLIRLQILNGLSYYIIIHLTFHLPPV